MIEKLRQKFSEMFTQALRLQLVLKGVMKEEEFDKIKNLLKNPNNLFDAVNSLSVENSLLKKEIDILNGEKINIISYLYHH